MTTDTMLMTRERLLEPEAADYCRCSLRAFRNMGLPAYNSGGRKIYRRQDLDQAILARPWDKEARTRAGYPGSAEILKSSEFAERLRNGRRRPYKPRQKKALE